MSLRPHGPAATALHALGLLGLALLGAWASNHLAGASRRLPWGTIVVAHAAAPLATVPPPAPTPAPPSPTSEPRTAHAVPPRPSASPAAHPPQPPAPAPPVAAQAPITEISDAQAWAAYAAGIPFLDARRSAEYALGHIQGAWCTPVWEADLDDRLLTFKADRRPGPEDPIVIYCSGGDCRDSHLLAERLLAQGYGHLHIYRDGYPAWVAQGRPIQRGLP